ncbi:hypothetical protein GJ699_02350 [Duganella sp. FT80W]|uniref:Uncharacterized protein n=1 Tax=Duganella guangzhouensis TaxID=2666084 RepID=A0A6I2KTA7_9BURK|nr:hypothetical protein [Duganella guangzhouensis]MRW88821.1 hypothetical protein [Duganella guangzhouensis]
MSAVTHITAGKASRLAVSGLLHFDYQDSGFEDVLNSGNLDAPEQAPAGSHISRYQIAGRSRNSVAPQLAAREFGLTYTVTERTAAGARSYTAIGAAGALADAAYDNGAIGVTVMVRP